MDANCQCLEPNLGRSEEDGSYLGTDATNGRYGSVHIYTCPNCGRIWIFYQVEYEELSGSGRWYRAIITPATARTVTPETAVQAIADSEYQIYGGSYFSSPGKIHRGPIVMDVES